MACAWPPGACGLADPALAAAAGPVPSAAANSAALAGNAVSPAITTGTRTAIASFPDIADNRMT